MISDEDYQKMLENLEKWRSEILSKSMAEIKEELAEYIMHGGNKMYALGELQVLQDKLIELYERLVFKEEFWKYPEKGEYPSVNDGDVEVIIEVRGIEDTSKVERRVGYATKDVHHGNGAMFYFIGKNGSEVLGIPAYRWAYIPNDNAKMVDN